MTVKEYMEKYCYTDYIITDTKYERGYLSRKTINQSILEKELHFAGGKRKGCAYVYEPCFHSSNYIFRYYLKFIAFKVSD